jgi:hypothetical protein
MPLTHERNACINAFEGAIQALNYSHRIDFHSAIDRFVGTHNKYKYYVI